MIQHRKGIRLLLFSAVFSAMLFVFLAGGAKEVGATYEQGYYTGIDVSSHNGTMNWERAIAAGVEFAIIRIGYGDNYYSQDDTQAVRNIYECERLGIPYGVYIYSYALSEKEVDSEIAHTLRIIEGHECPLGVWFDMEDADYYKERNGFSPYTHGTQLTEFCLRYIRGIKAAGYPLVGVYANTDYFNNVLNYSKLKNEGPIWLAHWGSKAGWPYDMWQYTAQGMKSINGDNFDVNRIEVGNELAVVFGDTPDTPVIYTRPADAPFAFGDVNGDGLITLSDLSLMKDHVTAKLQLEGDAFDCADLNGDGELTLSDLTMVKKHILGLTETDELP